MVTKFKQSRDRLRRRFSAASVGRPVMVGIFCGLLVALLVAPTALRGDAYFTDWTNHLWLIAKQSQEMGEQGGLPSLFMSTPQTGFLYPQFLFYGGTVYAAFGYVALLLGSSTAAYSLSWILGFSAAYGGLWWGARIAGVSRIASHVPAVLYVSSAYYLTNVYARGAWTEFLAVSALPLGLACAARHVSGTRTPLLASIGLALSVAVIVGGHVITTIWAVTVLAAVGIVTASWSYPRLRTCRDRLPRLALALGLGVAQPAWQYLPAVPWLNKTLLATDISPRVIAQRVAAPVESLQVLLSPWRFSPEGLTTPHFFTQEPSLAMLWVVGALGALAAFRKVRPGAPVLGLFAVLGGLIILTAWGSLWPHVPPPFNAAQFPYRLVTYVTLITCLLMIIALRRMQRQPMKWRGRQLWLGAAWSIVLLSAGAGIWQAWSAPTYGRASSVVADLNNLPKTFYAVTDYRVKGHRAPIGKTAISGEALRPSTVALNVEEAPAGRHWTPVVWSPGITGTGRITEVAADSSGWAIVDLKRQPRPPSPVGTQLRAGSGISYGVGAALTLVALAALGGLILVFVLRGVGRDHPKATGPET